MDYKHLAAAVVGLILGILGTALGIDFSKSCPPAPVPTTNTVTLPQH